VGVLVHRAGDSRCGRRLSGRFLAGGCSHSCRHAEARFRHFQTWFYRSSAYLNRMLKRCCYIKRREGPFFLTSTRDCCQAVTRRRGGGSAARGAEAGRPQLRRPPNGERSAQVNGIREFAWREADEARHAGRSTLAPEHVSWSGRVRSRCTPKRRSGAETVRTGRNEEAWRALYGSAVGGGVTGDPSRTRTTVTPSRREPGRRITATRAGRFPNGFAAPD